MKKIVLFLIPILLINLGFALDLSLEKPTNSTYTQSINIPIEFTLTDTNGTCHYLLNGGIPISFRCQDTSFSVDYDGSYNFTMFSYNGTDSISSEVDFSVDRTSEFEEGKPFLVGIIIIFLISLSFFILKIYDRISETIPYIKFIILFISIITMTSAGFISIFAINEYLKFKVLEYWLSILGYNVFLLIIFIIMLTIALFLVNHVRSMSKKR